MCLMKDSEVEGDSNKMQTTPNLFIQRWIGEVRIFHSELE